MENGSGKRKRKTGKKNGSCKSTHELSSSFDQGKKVKKTPIQTLAFQVLQTIALNAIHILLLKRYTQIIFCGNLMTFFKERDVKDVKRKIIL